MSESERKGSFWTTLPGILTATAGVITAVTGLLLAFGQLGLLGDGGDEVPREQSQTLSPPGEDATAVTADAIAGTWSGEARQRPGGAFEVRLQIGDGCPLKERCGSISVSHVPCFGDLYFYDFVGGRYEFSVRNFSPASGDECSPGAGEYLTPLDDGTLLYTTGYDASIRGILRPRA